MFAPEVHANCSREFQPVAAVRGVGVLDLHQRLTAEVTRWKKMSLFPSRVRVCLIEKYVVNHWRTYFRIELRKEALLRRDRERKNQINPGASIQFRKRIKNTTKKGWIVFLSCSFKASPGKNKGKEPVALQIVHCDWELDSQPDSRAKSSTTAQGGLPITIQSFSRHREKNYQCFCSPLSLKREFWFARNFEC